MSLSRVRSSSLKNRNNSKVGSGLFNKFLNSSWIPELHVPSYQYLGPFTNLEKRLERGDPGINPLDQAAKEHDLYYSQHKDTKSRHIADRELENKAWDRVLAKDAKFPEKVAAYLTTNAMKVKRKLGMGISKQTKKKTQSGKGVKSKRNKHMTAKKKGGQITFGNLVQSMRKAIKGKSKDAHSDRGLKSKIKKALNAIGSRKGVVQQNGQRIIPIPKTGGALPLIPIVAGLAKIGAIAGGVNGIINTIRNILNLRKSTPTTPDSGQQVGNGLFLHRHRKGYGLFLTPARYAKR